MIREDVELIDENVTFLGVKLKVLTPALDLTSTDTMTFALGRTLVVIVRNEACDWLENTLAVVRSIANTLQHVVSTVTKVGDAVG